MKDFIVKNKVVLAVIAIILVGALLVGVIVLGKGASNNDNTKPTGDSQGTTQGTEDTTNPSNATDPTDATDPSENTNPSESTDPSQGTDPTEGTEPSEPTQPSEGTEPSEGTQPTEPPVTNPPVTEPPVTNPPETEPPVTNPPVTEPPVVIQPTTYPTEPEDNGYKGVTPETLTEEAVKDWDGVDWSKFQVKYWPEMTPEERHYFQILQENNGVYYYCGTEDHHCVTPLEHENRMTFVCTYCGQIDCDGWVWHPDTLRGMYNQEKCPAYSEFKDPGEYCQTCGKHTADNSLSLTETCNKSIASQNCYYCGVWKEANACHTCKAEDVKDEFKHRVW